MERQFHRLLNSTENTMADFASLIEQERTRLNKIIDDLTTKRDAIDTQIAEAQRELSAITAYEKAKAPVVKKTRTPRAATSKRSELLETIKANPGATRADLIEKLGIKGNKSAEQALSNKLSNMKKAGTITATDGKYTAV